MPPDVTRGGPIDYLVYPAFLGCSVAAMWGAQRLGVPALWLTPAVIAVMVAIAWVLERLRPERLDYLRLDLPWNQEAGHFLLGFEAGSIAGYGAILGADALLSPHRPTPLWPTGWPMALQVVLAVFLGEVLSYWQHRCAHRWGWAWRFHAVHHKGGRLNLVRAGRFHFLDVGSAVILTYIPAALLGAPPLVITWLGVISGTLGLIQHADIRMRTPRWLDLLVCTPAVHRLHHSKVFRESDGNFATTFMIFDWIFSSYIRPDGPGPSEIGIENDPVSPRFWRQTAGLLSDASGAEPLS